MQRRSVAILAAGVVAAVPTFYAIQSAYAATACRVAYSVANEWQGWLPGRRDHHEPR